MRRALLTQICFSATAFIFVLQVFSANLYADDRADKVDQLFKRWDRKTSPGASVVVLKEGKLLLSKGYGMANLEHDVPNSSKTIFHVASVSKQFAAFAVFLLQEDKKLSIDDDIRKHIPELPDFGKKITIKHLIQHTSGLRDQWELLVLAGWRMDDVITHRDAMDLIKAQKELNFEPGERYLYCNSGYTLLAEIVQRVSGKSLRKFCQERIFQPLKMNHTHFHDNHRQIVPNRSDCYWPRLGGWQKAVLSYAIVGATSLFTTTEDLAKWQRNFETKEIGGELAHQLLHQRGVLNNGKKINYAGGIFHGVVSGHPVVGHSGGDAGYACHVERFKDHNLSVIVLANTTHVPTRRLALQIGLIYLPKTEGVKKSNPNQTKKVTSENAATRSKNQAESDKNQSSAKKKKTNELQGTQVAANQEKKREIELSDYVGTYYSPELDVSYKFSIQKDRLYLSRRKYGRGRCRNVREDAFVVNSGLQLGVFFEREPKSKKVTGFRMNSSRIRNLRFEKTE